MSQTDGVAIPDSAGLSGTTQGMAGFNSCSGTPTTPSNQNNVVRNPPSLNSNPQVPSGQIGINQNVWPLIQLFTLSNDVQIEYNRSTGIQSVDLNYFDIPNISLSLDRTGYPSGADVFATIDDAELSVDPTSQDSWTFNVGSNSAVFYQAFAESGSSASGSGLVNLMPYLSGLGFKDNGKLSMDTSDVVNLKTNSVQTSLSLSGIYDKLVTFVETGPHTGIFETPLLVYQPLEYCQMLLDLILAQLLIILKVLLLFQVLLLLVLTLVAARVNLVLVNKRQLL